MSDWNHFLVFDLDDKRYALGLSGVERVVRAVEVTSLPKAPEIVLGVVNLQGRVIAVVNIRKRFSLAERPMRVSDHLIIANSTRRTLALAVDAVGGVIERTEKGVVPAETIIPGLEYLKGVAKLEDGLILIHDLDKCLALEEERALDEALRDM